MAARDLGLIKVNTDNIEVMTGATSTTNGKAGLAPAPTKNDSNKFLRGDGTWAGIETIKGDPGPAGKDGKNGTDGTPGKDGTAAGFGKVTATVDNGSGTPSVTVTATGPDTAKNFSFAFSNLKGEKGETPSLDVLNGLSFGQDTEGNWGYIAPGANTVTTFNSNGGSGNNGEGGSLVGCGFTDERYNEIINSISNIETKISTINTTVNTIKTTVNTIKTTVTTPTAPDSVIIRDWTLLDGSTWFKPVSGKEDTWQFIGGTCGEIYEATFAVTLTRAIPGAGFYFTFPVFTTDQSGNGKSINVKYKLVGQNTTLANWISVVSGSTSFSDKTRAKDIYDNLLVGLNKFVVQVSGYTASTVTYPVIPTFELRIPSTITT